MSLGQTKAKGLFLVQNPSLRKWCCSITDTHSPQVQAPTHSQEIAAREAISSSPGISLAMTEGGLVWLVLTCWWVMTWQHWGTALFTMYSVSGTLDMRTIRRRTRSVCSTIISSSTDCNDSPGGSWRHCTHPTATAASTAPETQVQPCLHHSNFVRPQNIWLSISIFYSVFQAWS